MQSFSNTDSFIAVYVTDPTTNQLKKVANSALVKDTQNPVYPMPFDVDYVFEAIQEVVVKVYHHDGKHDVTDESKHTFLGKGTFFMSNLMCTNGERLVLDITDGKKIGKVMVKGETITNTNDLLCVTFAGTKLTNKDGWFGKSDPFLVIQRVNEDGTWSSVWQSVRIDNSLNPKWAAVKISMSVLCNGDIDRPLKIQVFDWDKDGTHDSMGDVETSVRSMLQAGSDMPVIEADKKTKKKGYTNSGTLTASNVMIEHHPTFAQFITGGLDINLVVAIDFTGSNGDPMQPGSLHHINPSGAHNAYQNAILGVASVLEPYDTDKQYSVYGFGAKIRQADGTFSPVQHCFPVYGGGVQVSGINGIMQAYTDCLQNVALSGPTIFSPLIQASSHIAAGTNCRQDNQHYTILLILTDGVINDVPATINSIIDASKQPMSIIIVGIGSADFGGMEVLDSDKQMLSAGRKTAERDIVQFVSFESLNTRGNSALALDVLAEIPDQVLKYMAKHNITPTKK